MASCDHPTCVYTAIRTVANGHGYVIGDFCLEHARAWDQERDRLLTYQQLKAHGNMRRTQ